MSGGPWKKSESGKLWNLYLSGAELKSIADALPRRSVAEIKLRVQQLTRNERDLAIRYEPFHRTSRKGKRLNAREGAILAEHKQRKVPLEATANLLQRPVSEINEDWKQIPEAKSLAVFAPTLDVVMAHRYIYHVYKTPIISNKAYDDLFKEEVEYGGGGRALGLTKDGFWGPKRIKTLALYLVERYEDEYGKPPEKVKVPYRK